MKIQKKLFLSIGGCVLISSLLVLVFTISSSLTFFANLRDDEQKYMQEEIIRKNGLSVYFERQLFDSNCRMVMVFLERFAHQYKRFPEEMEKRMPEILQKLPSVSEILYCRVSAVSNNQQTESIRCSGEGKFLRKTEIPQKFRNFIHSRYSDEKASLLFIPGEKNTLYMVIAFRRAEDLQENKISAFALLLKDDFLKTALGQQKTPGETCFLYNGFEVLSSSGELPGGPFMKDLKGIFATLKDNCENGNSHAEFVMLDNQRRIILSSSKIATSCYGTNDHIRLFHVQNHCGNNLSFFTLLLKDYYRFLLIFICMILAGLFVLCPVMLWLSRRISAQLKAVSDFADTLAQGDFPKEPLFLDGSEELSSLSISLNRMRDRLNSQIIKLKRAHKRELEERKLLEKSSLLTANCMTRLSRCLFHPSNQIAGFCSLMKEKISDLPEHDEELSAMLTQISDGVEKLPWINDTILEIGRYHQQDGQGTPEAVNVLMLLQNLRESFSGRMQQRGMHLEIRYSNTMPQNIFADRSLLKRTLALLVSTLILASRNGGKISAGCVRENGKIVFWAGGQGCENFPLEEITGGTSAEKIPEMYVTPCVDYRLAKEYAAWLKGELEFVRNSENLDMRLSFSSEDVADFLSDHKPAAVPNATQTFIARTLVQDPKQISGGTLLFLEPDPVRGDLIRMTMNRTSLKTLITSNLQQYYELIRKEHPEILLFDRETPEIDIHTLLFDLKQSFPHGRFQVLLLISSPDEQKLEAFRNLGVKHFLMKPVDFKQFYSLLAHIMESFR